MNRCLTNDAATWACSEDGGRAYDEVDGCYYPSNSSTALGNSCSQYSLLSIQNRLTDAIRRMQDIVDTDLPNMHELNPIEQSFLNKFKTLNKGDTPIAEKILREYFTTCRLQYRYTLIIEPLSVQDTLTINVNNLIETLQTMIDTSVNEWFLPFVELNLFGNHTHVDCVCVEAIFQQGHPSVKSTEGIYLTTQGSNNSDSVSTAALWWKKGGTFNAFSEYGQYIQTKCPSGTFVACPDTNSMHEITYHTRRYKNEASSGTMYTTEQNEKQFSMDGTTKKYSRFNKHIIIRRIGQSLINHEFGHALFNIQDTLTSDSSYNETDLRRNGGSCYEQTCVNIFPLDYHFAADVLLRILRRMNNNQ